METLIFILLNQRHSVLNLFDAKITECLQQIILSSVLYGTWTCCQVKFFLPSKPLQHTDDDEMFALAKG